MFNEAQVFIGQMLKLLLQSLLHTKFSVPRFLFNGSKLFAGFFLHGSFNFDNSLVVFAHLHSHLLSLKRLLFLQKLDLLSELN